MNNKDWEVVQPKRFINTWQRRGLPHDQLSKAQSDCLIRCDVADKTIGFFVALFQKKAMNKSHNTNNTNTSSINHVNNDNSNKLHSSEEESQTTNSDFEIINRKFNNNNNKYWKSLSNPKFF